MAYLGRGLDKGNYLKLDDLQSQFNGSTTTFNLTSGGTAFYPGSAFSILVSLAGIVQEPESAYQINQNQIIFAAAPLSSDDFFCIVLGVPLAVGVAGNSTITGTQLSKPFNYNDGHLFFDSVNNRLGINSTTPRQELDVRGNVIVSNNLGIATVNPLHRLQVGSRNDFVTIVSAAGTVGVSTNSITGINTSSIAIGHEVVGVSTIVSSGTIVTSIGIGTVGIGTTTLNTTIQTGVSFSFGVKNDSKLVVVTSEGSIGIGTTNPSHNLHILGNSRLEKVAISSITTQFQVMETGYVYVYYSGITSFSLPPSPTIGSTVRIINRSGITTAIVLRNGNKIMGVADDLEFDELNATFSMTYASDTDGWILSR